MELLIKIDGEKTLKETKPSYTPLYSPALGGIITKQLFNKLLHHKSLCDLEEARNKTNTENLTMMQLTSISTEQLLEAFKMLSSTLSPAKEAMILFSESARKIDRGSQNWTTLNGCYRHN